MIIKKHDIEQSKDLDDLLLDLIEKYYPNYDDDSYHNLDVVTQTFVLIIDADGQINNGGIIQFIDNGTGNRFHETIEAAKRINNAGLANTLTQATTQFPNGQIPKDWNYRRALWDELCEQHEEDEAWNNFWTKLDEWYYSNTNTIYQNLIDYLKTNATLGN